MHTWIQGDTGMWPPKEKCSNVRSLAVDHKWGGVLWTAKLTRSKTLRKWIRCSFSAYTQLTFRNLYCITIIWSEISKLFFFQSWNNFRYSYDEDYEEVIEDVAASLDLESFHYIFVEESNYAEVTIGVVPRRTLDIAVRRIFKAANQRPDKVPRDRNPLRCTVLIPDTDGK